MSKKALIKVKYETVVEAITVTMTPDQAVALATVAYAESTGMAEVRGSNPDVYSVVSPLIQALNDAGIETTVYP